MAKRTLICDDAAFMRMMLKDILSKGGYEVVGEAQNGQRAVEQYAALKPDFVMMDTVMPEMDGVAALREIRKQDPAACVIMCAANGENKMLVEAVKLGAKSYVMKPYQAATVLEELKKAIG